MIWFDISKLEKKISKNELSEKDGLNYVLAFFILEALTMGTDSQVENTWIKLLNCFLMVLITIWGLNKAYKANTEIDGKDFFKRFFAISWVIGMRMLSVIMFIAFLLGAILVIISLANDTFPGKNLYKGMTATIFMSLFEVIYYLLIINSIRKLKPITE